MSEDIGRVASLLYFREDREDFERQWKQPPSVSDEEFMIPVIMESDPFQETWENYYRLARASATCPQSIADLYSCRQ